MLVVPAYGWDEAPAAPTPTGAPGYPDQSSRPQEPNLLTGTLSLDVQPYAAVQLYVDGFFVGTPEDFNGELTLEPGPHKVDLRAPGYETVSLDVTISPGRAITYRATLRPVDAKPEPTAPSVDVKPTTSKPIYVIPGCYIGNVPPKDAGLPATCDLSRATTLQR